MPKAVIWTDEEEKLVLEKANLHSSTSAKTKLKYAVVFLPKERRINVNTLSEGLAFTLLKNMAQVHKAEKLPESQRPPQEITINFGKLLEVDFNKLKSEYGPMLGWILRAFADNIAASKVKK